jgi:hypothetical protein
LAHSSRRLLIFKGQLSVCTSLKQIRAHSSIGAATSVVGHYDMQSIEAKVRFTLQRIIIAPHQDAPTCTA